MTQLLLSSKSKYSLLSFLLRVATLCLFFLLATSFYSRVSAETFYVKPTATGLGTGATWIDASGDLQAIINAANAGDEVWVAGGTYPITAPVKEGMKLKEGVKIYGGFAGTEEALTDRNLKLPENKSVITGGGTHDYTIYNMSATETDGLTRATVLDGFTVTGATSAGIVNGQCSPTLSNMIITGNGGPRYDAAGVINTNSSPLFINVTITNNEGVGALFNLQSSPILINCSIVDNIVFVAGVGNNESSPVFINCTIAVQKSQSINVVAIKNQGNSVPRIRNSILYAIGRGIENDAASSSDIQDSREFTEGIYTPTGFVLNEDLPLFEDPASGNYRLQKCSAAVNAGNNIYYASGQIPDISAIVTDIDGYPRFFDGGNVDLGAYEYQGSRSPMVTGIRFVKPGGTGSGINWECALGNLQTAVNIASAGEQVWVAGGEYLLGNKPLAMKEGVKIYGGFAGTETSLANRDLSLTDHKSTLRGTGTAVVQNVNSELTMAAVLDGFTISGTGGGIGNYYASPMLVNLLITANPGGGIANNNASPIITNCAIVGNKGTGFVFGIYNSDASFPVITNCTIADNTSTASQSVGIANQRSSPKIRNCIISGNVNGIVNQINSSPAIEYSIVESNQTLDPVDPSSTNIDPLFVNRAGGNYRLQPCSPGVNTGFNYFQPGQTPDLTGITTDLDNKPRLREHIVDMGAYEFGGASRELADDLDEASATITRDYVLTSSDSDCRLVAYILPNGAAPAAGYVSAKVWVANSQPSNFVKRHYEITPATNTHQATARVTLYFTQQDFTDFNGVNEIKLPLNAADEEGYKANLRIEKRPGFSINGSGLPNSYIGEIATFKPSDANGKVDWNADANYWEVTFDVTGFSGFFVKTTESALPLNLISFTATKEAGGNLLQWSTTSEVNTDNFEIQRSGDAKNFIKIAIVDAVGHGDFQYSYNDRDSNGGTNYYRLKMSDRAANRLDGTYTFSKIISLKSDGELAGIYPNPAGALVTFQISDALLKTTANLYDITGRRIQSIVITSNKQQINTKSLTSGIYILKFADGTGERFVKE